MEINKLFFIFIICSTCVSATFGATCKGNNLVYYDLNDKPIIKDCSILHSGQGQVFPGECKEFKEGDGADCYRLNGTVTPEYRNQVRGYTYNTSLSPWDPGFIVSTTTTTLAASITVPVVSCPKCDVCVNEDCSSYKVTISRLNMSDEYNRQNAEAYRAEVASMIDKAAYQSAMKDKNLQINESQFQLAQCSKEKTDISGWNNTYIMVAGVSVVIMLIVVFIWVKFELYGNLNASDPFGPLPKKKLR